MTDSNNWQVLFAAVSAHDSSIMIEGGTTSINASGSVIKTLFPQNKVYFVDNSLDFLSHIVYNFTMNRPTLIIYQDSKGKEPLVEWLKKLRDIKIKARIQNRIRRLELGHFGDYKSLGAGLYELRLDFGPGYRVYYAKKSDCWVLLLCGGDKKTQAKDIDRTKAYWNDYKQRYKHES